MLSPATNNFVIYRATAADGTYVNYTGVITGTTFSDGNVSDGVWYYYKVQPALPGSVTSTYNTAQTFPLPPTVGDRITRLATGAPAQRVLLNGSYLYIAIGSSGLMVVNVSNPRAPSVVTTIATTDAQDLSLYSNTLVVADGSGGIRVFDVSAPSAPIHRKTLSWAAGTKATAVAAAGYGAHAEVYVLLVDTVPNPDTTSIRVIDISTPSTPSSVVERRSYANGAVVFTDVEARGYSNTVTMVYVAAKETIVDTTYGYLYEHYYNSGTTAWTAWHSYDYPIDGYQDYNPTKLVMDSNGLLYSLALTNVMIELPYYKMLVLDTYLSGAGTIILRGETGSLYGEVQDITLSGATVYAANGWGLQVFDVSSTTTPQATGYWNTPGPTFGVAASGTWAYVASGDLGLQDVDAAGASSMSLMNAASNPAIGDMVIREDFAYTVSSTFRVMDIHDPSAPVVTGSAGITGGNCVALSGPWAFVADGSAGLTVVDITNSSSPQIIASTRLTGTLQAVAVLGDYAYAAEYGSLQIFDISDPQHPSALFTSYLDADTGMRDIAIREGLAYITDGNYFRPSSLRVIDVTDPTAPHQIGASPATGASTVWGVSLQGTHAFVTDSFPGTGLYSVNIDPSSASYLTMYGPCDIWPSRFPTRTRATKTTRSGLKASRRVKATLSLLMDMADSQPWISVTRPDCRMQAS